MDIQEINNDDQFETAHENEVAPVESESNEEIGSDLSRNLWSVVTFDNLAASGLTYNEAMLKMAQLTTENVSGLCIITDDAAFRIGK